MQKIEVANESPILKKRRWLHVDKVTCWELVAEVQLMVDVASRCDIERSIDEIVLMKVMKKNIRTFGVILVICNFYKLSHYLIILMIFFLCG